MGTAKRNAHPALIAELLREPGGFDFLRAVQVLEAQRTARQPGADGELVGFDRPPSETGLRFGSSASLAFPAKSIASVRAREGPGETAYDVAVSFLGLVGPAGTLPVHYTETVLQRLHAKDASLGDFLDAFQDRGIALFYRAWKKYRLPLAFASSDPARGKLDPVLNAILALLGLLPRARAKPVHAIELAQAHHAGLFADRRRSAAGLRAMLRGLLRCEVAVEEFVGQWIDLDRAAWSRLGDGEGGAPARLGDESVLGARVWSVDARVRVVAGPLDRARFRELWPGGAPVRFLWQLVRAYLGPLIECELVWQLAPDAPAAQHLGSDQRLGRDAWLGWGGNAAPDTRVASPPWHNSRPGSIAPGSVSHDSNAARDAASLAMA